MVTRIGILALTLAAGAAGVAPLTLSQEATALVLAGLEPAGSQVVWFSVARSSDGLVAWTHNRSDVLWDHNEDGIIRIDRGPAPPVKFLAAAVELASGRFAILSPLGSPVAEVAPHDCPPEDDDAGPCDEIAGVGAYVEVLLVRPASGAWTLSSGDGGPADLGLPHNGVIRISPAAMEPVGQSPSPPAELRAGDVVVWVAPRPMEYSALRIGG